MSSAAPSSSALVAAMSFQISAGSTPAASCRRVRGPASARPSGPTRVADDLHQRARGELRQMTEKREQPIVRLGADDARLGAERRDKGQQLLERCAAAIVDRRQEPRAPLEQIRTRVLEPARAPRRPSGCPPMNVNRGGSPRAAATISRFVLPVSVITRRLPHVLVQFGRGRRDSAAPAPRESRCRPPRARSDRRPRRRSRAAASRSRARPCCRRAITSDAGHSSPRRQRNRSADEPEADDADLREDRLCAG